MRSAPKSAAARRRPAWPRHAPVLLVLQDLEGARGHALDVAHGQQEAGLGVLDDLGQPARVRAHHRHARGHGLQRGQAEGLQLGGQQEHVGHGHDVLDVVLPSQEAHAVGDARGGAPGPGRRRAPAPRPTISSTAGTSRLTRSKMRTTSSTRFTGRKFETWSSTFSPGRASASGRGARAARRARGPRSSGWPRSGSRTSNSSTVIRLRNSETAVTPSERSMPKRVISKNERSWPTSVMSVPWRVVTSRGACVPSICWARKPVIAWGIA